MLKSALRTLALATLVGALVFAAFLYVIAWADCSLVGCSDKGCSPGAASDMASPDGRYVVRKYSSFCGPSVAASYTYRVVLRTLPKQNNGEILIYQEEDGDPTVRWIDNDKLEISPGSYRGVISHSERSVEGMRVEYQVDMKMASDALDRDQKGAIRNFGPDDAKRINAFSRDAFNQFREWARDYAGVSAEHH